MSLSVPEGYQALAEDSVAAYLAGVPDVRARLGGAPEAWRVREVGDGNLNLVFIVEGPAGDVCVKQALPYVRLVGESWPLPLLRAWFEHEAASIQQRNAPGLVTAILHYDPLLYLTVMERLSPHVIMRRGMIEGVVYQRVEEIRLQSGGSGWKLTTSIAALVPAATVRTTSTAPSAVARASRCATVPATNPRGVPAPTSRCRFSVLASTASSSCSFEQYTQQKS